MLCLVCLLLYKEEGSSPVALQLLRGGIWACMRCACLFSVGYWNGDIVNQLPYGWYYVVRNASQRGPMCFRCVMFTLSATCELFFCFVLLPLGLELW